MDLVARDAASDDHGALVRLFAELHVPDGAPTFEQFEARIRPYAFFLWRDGHAIGYAFWHALGDVARVSHVAVDPSARGQGVGGAVMREIAARARRAGCSRWELNVLPDNVPAVRLYERCGMRAVARDVAMRVAWNDVPRLPLEQGTQALFVEPEDEARVESAVGLLPGQIAVHRRAGHVLPSLRRGGDVVAFAGFDPSAANARHFFAARAALARPLLEAMRPHALIGASVVRLVVDEGAVASAMAEAGAETVFTTVRMHGPMAY